MTLVPIPAEWVASLSPRAADVWKAAGAGPLVPLSLDPHSSWSALLKTLGLGAVFFLCLAVVNNRSRMVTLVEVLVYAAVLHSLYAVLMHLSDAASHWFGTTFSHAGSASGFFRNRNHFAGYLVMTLSLGIGLLVATVSDSDTGGWRKRLKALLEWILSGKMVLRLSLCILVIALTTTHSRMGNTAFFSALLIAGVIGIALSRYATRATTVLLTSLVVLDLALVGGWFGVGKLVERLEATTVAEVQERETPAYHTLTLIQDYPVFGAGAGSFAVVFPAYRPASVTAFYDHAHNDYAQFAAETGVVGLALMGLFVLMALWAALRAQWVRRDPLMRGLSFACIMGVAALLIHSAVDFNLQIPSNAAYFLVLLALGWISLYFGRAPVAPELLSQKPRPVAGDALEAADRDQH